MADPQTTSDRPAMTKTKTLALVGWAALQEMLFMIGEEGKTDHDIAQILTSYEPELTCMMNMFKENLS